MEQFAVFMQRSQHARSLFDHDDLGGATRHRFEAKGTAAGEEVEAAPAVQFLAEPVEQRFPNAVRRRTQAFTVRKFEDAAAILAADDAYRVQSAATVTVISSAGRTWRAKACLIWSA